MCKNPMWRVPVKEYIARYLFGSELRGYRNGAFIVSQQDPMRLEFIMSMLSQNPKAYSYAEEGISVIGCGQCLECKINKSKEWAQRSVAEAQMHFDNWFITLTYDDEHLPPAIPTFSRHNFEFGLWSPLLYVDFVDFKKRLLEHFRYHFNVDGIRFLMCGEYGPQSGRPHFHVIFYNLPLPDVEKHSEQSVGGKSYVYMTSKLIEEKWGKGFVTLGEVNWETSAYVGRYVLKKFNNLDEYEYCKLCHDYGWEPLPPEIREASRRPGLARPFYDEHKDEIYAFDKVVLPNGQTPKPCSYFDRLYDLEEPVFLAALKKRRKEKALLHQRNEQSKFKNSTEYQEYKNKKSEKFARSISKLKRPL